MITKLSSIIPDGVIVMPVETYITRAWPYAGRNRVRELLNKKQVRVNGEKVAADTSVHAGEELTVYYDGNYDFSLEFLFDDGCVMAFIKPEGLPVDRDENDVGEDTVLTRLKLTHPNARLVHRLDTGTGGLMLAANNENTEALLLNAFKNHLLTKQYEAVVWGKMPMRHERLTGFLEKDAKTSRVRITGKKSDTAKDIETIYTVLEEFQIKGHDASRLAVEIPTGRTHQIRAHMAHVGHPLVGDDKYGDRTLNKLQSAKDPVLKCVKITMHNDEALGVYAGKKFDLGMKR